MMKTQGWLMEGNNHFLNLPAWVWNETDLSRTPQTVTLFYLVPGNPGLIGYYRDFLSQLSETRSEIIIAGVSLGGFEMPRRRWGCVRSSSSKIESELRYPPGVRWRTIYRGLAEQVELTHARIAGLIKNLNDIPKVKGRPLQVVLAGHSIGAYIALEVVRLQHEQLDTRLDALESRQHESNSYNIVATMLLTPTIHNPTRSRWRQLKVPVLNYLPFFPALTQFGASALTTLLPRSWLGDIVPKITGIKNANALLTTINFLNAPNAVKQALMMLGQEIIAVGPDKEIHDIWGPSNSAQRIDADAGTWSDDAASSLTVTTEHQTGISHKMVRYPKHFFLFTKQDRWLAETIRDAAIEADRGQIVIDDSDLVHAWCLEQSEGVSDTVSEWVKCITDQGLGSGHA